MAAEHDYPTRFAPFEVLLPLARGHGEVPRVETRQEDERLKDERLKDERFCSSFR